MSINGQMQPKQSQIKSFLSSLNKNFKHKFKYILKIIFLLKKFTQKLKILNYITKTILE